MANDPYTDDEYDDTYKNAHGDEPARDQYTNEATDDTFFPSGVGGSLTPMGWGIWPSNDPVDAERADREAGYGEDRGEYEGRTGVRTEDTEDDSWWDEGLIGLLLVAGVVLFFFPEPATSAIGIGLITVGALAWIIDWLA